MDLFAVDSWASDKATDDLNTSLFGEIHVPDKRKGSTIDKIANKKAAKREKKKRKKSVVGCEKEDISQFGKTSRLKRKQEHADATSVRNSKQSDGTVPKKKKKKTKKVNAEAEIVDTNCEGNDSPCFKKFLVTDSEKSKQGGGVLKKKRKKSTKKNKYKHLDEIRKAHRESVGVGENKLDVDINAKLNSKVTSEQSIETNVVNENVDQERPLPKKKEKKKLKTVELKECRQSNVSEDQDVMKKLSESSAEKPEEKEVKKSKKRRANNENVENDESQNLDNSIPRKKKKKGSSATNTVDSENTKSDFPVKTSKKCAFNSSLLKEALMKENSKTHNLKENNQRNKRKNMTLKERMMEKLSAARFRHLNEQLYSIPGHEVSTVFHIF